MDEVKIKCGNCSETFEPDLKTRESWVCPGCTSKNTNLRIHYRSVADICIIGVVMTFLLMIFTIVNQKGITGENYFGFLLEAAWAVLLIYTIVLIYRAGAPWQSRKIKGLIWVVFGGAFFFNVIVPLLVGKLIIPMIIVYIFVFAYLLWLNSATKKLALPETAPIDAEIDTDKSEWS
ncbi:MAG: hypothetical protein M1269_08540 [Chloroflexi bacterium]|nr:hypothetical protein [Chloroflexota bacterium]